MPGFYSRGCGDVTAECITFAGPTGARKFELIYVKRVAARAIPEFLSQDVDIAKVSTAEKIPAGSSARSSRRRARNEGVNLAPSVSCRTLQPAPGDVGLRVWPRCWLGSARHLCLAVAGLRALHLRRGPQVERGRSGATCQHTRTQ